MNTPRQPRMGSESSSGTLALIAPSPPAAMIAPVIADWRSGGYHCEKFLSPAIRHADTPNPISARPIVSVWMSLPSPNTSVPAAANSRIVASTRRGP